MYSFTLVRTCTVLQTCTELEPTGGAHRCCTRLALAVGDSTLVTKVAKNDCDFRAQRSPERMLILLTDENRQSAFLCSRYVRVYPRAFGVCVG